MIVPAVLALGVTPVVARPALAIAHGEDAPGDAYRFSVRLTMTDLPTADHGTRDSWCSGALIAPRWVITAGHCFRDAAGRRVSRPVAARTTATVGRPDLTGRDGRTAKVVAVHQAKITDVALAELDTPVTDIAPLRVGTAPPAAGEVIRLTGYGLTGAGGSATTDRLQTGQFTVDRVGDTVLETSGRAPHPETSPCPHDSGGPYFRQRPDGVPVLVAVVSSGPQCPHRGPDFSARTDILSDWIADRISRPDRGPFGPGLLRVGLGAGTVLLAASVAILLRRRRRDPRRGRMSAHRTGS